MSIFAGGSPYAPAAAQRLRGESVNIGYGVTLDFASGPISLWHGVGDLDAAAFSDPGGVAGPIFKGVGAWGKISAVEMGVSGATQALTLELSGVRNADDVLVQAFDPKFLAYAANQEAEIKGRAARLWLLFFDERFQLVAARVRRTLLMDRMTRSFSGGANDETPSAVVSLACEPILATKNRPPGGMLSDTDHRIAHPGDLALQYQAVLAINHTLIW